MHNTVHIENGVLSGKIRMVNIWKKHRKMANYHETLKNMVICRYFTVLSPNESRMRVEHFSDIF